MSAPTKIDLRDFLWRKPANDERPTRDDSRTYLPWLIAIMVFLAALAIAAAVAASSATSRWAGQLTGTLTVEIAPRAPNDARTPGERLAAALEIVRASPGVARAEPVSREHIADMLEPWLGKSTLVAELPLPQMIDVTITSGDTFNARLLDARLAAAVPGAGVDDHRRWLENVAHLSRLALVISLVIVALMTLATAGAVILTTRAGLASQLEAVELLHLMGARDSYIARQYASEALGLGLRGGLLGLAGAILAIVAVGMAVDAADPLMVPHQRLGALGWALLVLLPVLSALLARMTARRTVMRALKRMM
jgi:cell division transport system permease protein